MKKQGFEDSVSSESSDSICLLRTSPTAVWKDLATYLLVSGLGLAVFLSNASSIAIPVALLLAFVYMSGPSTLLVGLGEELSLSIDTQGVTGRGLYWKVIMFLPRSFDLSWEEIERIVRKRTESRTASGGFGLIEVHSKSGEIYTFKDRHFPVSSRKDLESGLHRAKSKSIKALPGKWKQ